MKILVGVSRSLDKGSGIATATRSLCEALLAQGDEIVLASPAFTDTSWLLRHGVTHCLTDPSAPQVEVAERLLRTMRDLQVDGVVNNDNSTLQSLAPLCEVPFVSIMHLPSYAIGALAAHNAEYLDYVVAISPEMQHMLIHRRGLPVHKVPLVYNGVRSIALGRKPADGAHPLRAVFAGGSDRRKGADLLASALESGRFAAVSLIVHWFGTIPASFHDRLRRIPNVEVRGALPSSEFLAELAQSDLLLLPSRVEGCPMVLLEAMCRGVVPIVSDGNGAMRWIVASGQNGYVCSLRNWTSELADCVAHLAANREVVQRFSLRARESYEQGLTSERSAGLITDLLHHPTIDRTRSRPNSAAVLQWTRPISRPGEKPSLWERYCYRAGRLRRAGRITAGTG